MFDGCRAGNGTCQDRTCSSCSVLARREAGSRALLQVREKGKKQEMCPDARIGSLSPPRG